MKRRELLCVVAAACGCRKQEAPFDPFPPVVAGVWHRVEQKDVPVSESPDPIPRSGVTRLKAATYDGPGKLEARIYETTAKAVAFERAQRWRPSADTVFFPRGRYFVVVKWQEADRKALQAFVREMEKHLPAE